MLSNNSVKFPPRTSEHDMTSGHVYKNRGIHDFTPPPGIKLQPGVLDFFRRHFDWTDDPRAEAAEAYINNFAEDGIFIGEQGRIVGRQAIRTLRHNLYPPTTSPSWTHRAGDIYPLNHGTVSDTQLYLITGTMDFPASAHGGRGMGSVDWRCSVQLIEVPGQGLKISCFNTLGNQRGDCVSRSVCCDLGMFRY